MRIYICTILFIIISSSANSQYWGVNDSLKNIINNKICELTVVIDNNLAINQKNAIAGDFCGNGQTIIKYYFFGTDLSSICNEVNIICKDTKIMNKMVQDFNKECVIVNDKKWLKYIGYKIYTVELGKGVDWPTFYIEEKKN